MLETKNREALRSSALSRALFFRQLGWQFSSFLATALVLAVPRTRGVGPIVTTL